MSTAAASNTIVNVPNVLSTLRFFLAIVVFALLPWQRYETTAAALVVFVIAVATDWVDGYWARRFNQVTKVGRMLDPFVDKIIICGTYIMLAAEQLVAGQWFGITGWMAVVVIGREILVTALRSRSSKRRRFFGQVVGQMEDGVSEPGSGRGDGVPDAAPARRDARARAVLVVLDSTRERVPGRHHHHLFRRRIHRRRRQDTPRVNSTDAIYTIMPSQPPAVMAAMFVLGAAVMVVLTLGPLVWFLVLWRRSRGEPVLVHEPRREANWGLIDLVAAFVLMIVFAITGAVLAQWISGVTLLGAGKINDNQARLYLMFVDAAGQDSGRGRDRRLYRTPHRVLAAGPRLLARRDLGRDLQLGGAAFCALAIPTYGLAVDSGAVLEIGPSVDRVAQGGSRPAVSGDCHLRGGGERSAHRGVRLPRAVPGLAGEDVPSAGRAATRLRREPADRRTSGQRRGRGGSGGEVAGERRSRSGGAGESAAPSRNSRLPNMQRHRPAWLGDVTPIAISSAIFAALHYTHGPDWIPLFGLALGLGYLYRRTHRITPGLVVHLLLNLVSMLALCVEIYQVNPK